MPVGIARLPPNAVANPDGYADADTYSYAGSYRDSQRDNNPEYEW